MDLRERIALSTDRHSGLYIIRHGPSGKIYLGSAADLARRRSEHRRMLLRGAHENQHLQHAWNKSSQSGFTWNVLMYCHIDELLFYEQRAIESYSKHLGWRNLYNESPIAGSRLHVKHSKATKEKMRKNNTRHFLGKHHSAATRDRISDLARKRWQDPVYREKHVGKQLSMETKQKIGASNSGRIPSEEVRMKISLALKGRVFSKTHKEKLTANRRAFTGRQHTQETKEKLRKALLGREFSSETRRRISLGVIAAWERRAMAQSAVSAEVDHFAPVPVLEAP